MPRWVYLWVPGMPRPAGRPAGAPVRPANGQGAAPPGPKPGEIGQTGRPVAKPGARARVQAQIEILA